MIFRRVSKGEKTKKEEVDIVRWRGHEVLRIEAFSDAVFAFAITLLVVSLEVPKTFDELLTLLKGFLPFGISFIMFFQVWVAQNLFFRRYGLHDERTITLNAALLFAMLFFVYPLKFLWTVLMNGKALGTDHDTVLLMYIYGAGFAVIYFLLGLMYAHAYTKKHKLKLTPTEAFETKTYAMRHIGTGMIGVLSIGFASLGAHYVVFAGMVYALIGVQVWMTHSKRGKVHHKKYGRSLHDANEEEMTLTDEQHR